MKKLEHFVPNLRGNLLCLSACYVIIGTVLLAFPTVSLVNVCSGIGIAAIIFGLINVAVYFIRRGYLSESNICFSVGMAAALFGLYAVLETERFSVGFTQVLAFCMIADGIVKLQFSMDLLRLRGRWWWLVLVGALVGAGLSMATLLYAFESQETKEFYTYLVLIIDGVLNGASVAYLSWQKKRFHSGKLEPPQDWEDEESGETEE